MLAYLKIGAVHTFYLSIITRSCHFSIPDVQIWIPPSISIFLQWLSSQTLNIMYSVVVWGLPYHRFWWSFPSLCNREMKRIRIQLVEWKLTTHWIFQCYPMSWKRVINKSHSSSNSASMLKCNLGFKGFHSEEKTHCFKCLWIRIAKNLFLT